MNQAEGGAILGQRDLGGGAREKAAPSSWLL